MDIDEEFELAYATSRAMHEVEDSQLEEEEAAQWEGEAAAAIMAHPQVTEGSTGRRGSGGQRGRGGRQGRGGRGSGRQEAQGQETTDRDGPPEMSPQYAEDMEEWQREELTDGLGGVITRLFLRRRWMERGIKGRSKSGATIGMEERERKQIKLEGTREVLRMALQLHQVVNFNAAYATDGSFDPGNGDVEEEDQTVPATAWGAYDGKTAFGGALPPTSGNHIAELVAIAEVLKLHEPGERVLILSDCRAALFAIERAWRAGSYDALRTTEGGEVIETIIRRRLRLGAVVFIFTPSHQAGIMPNAYADAIAKSHLSEEPQIPQLEVESRLVKYEAEDAGKQGRAGQFWPSYRAIGRLIRERLDMVAQGRLAPPPGSTFGRHTPGPLLLLGGEHAEGRRLWQYPLQRMSSGGGAARSDNGLPSGVGQSMRFRSGHIGAPYDGGGTRVGTLGGQPERCELCNAAVADGLHLVTCECSFFDKEQRERHRSRMRRRIEAMAAENPAAATEPTADTTEAYESKDLQRPRSKVAAVSVVPAGRTGMPFVWARAHAGQCQSDTQMVVEEESAEAEYFVPRLKQVFEAARRTAAKEGAVLGDELSEAVDAVCNPGQGAGIAGISLVYGQLSGAPYNGMPEWAEEERERREEIGAQRWETCTRRTFNRKEGAERRSQRRTVAFPPRGRPGICTGTARDVGKATAIHGDGEATSETK